MEKMNHKLSPETRERLAHALARLQSEPRSGDRRALPRRRAVLPDWLIIEERRGTDERRRTDRRTS